MGYFQVIVIYDCKMFIRLAPEINHFDWIVQFKGLVLTGVLYLLQRRAFIYS